MPYPDNMKSPRYFYDRVACKKCDNTAKVEFVTDCGMTDFVDEQDSVCTECGGDME